MLIEFCCSLATLKKFTQGKLNAAQIYQAPFVGFVCAVVASHFRTTTSTRTQLAMVAFDWNPWCGSARLTFESTPSGRWRSSSGSWRPWDSCTTQPRIPLRRRATIRWRQMTCFSIPMTRGWMIRFPVWKFRITSLRTCKLFAIIMLITMFSILEQSVDQQTFV